jgi:hypothetical protein
MNLLREIIGMELVGSQKDRKTEANLEKDRFEGSKKMWRNMNRV